MKKTVALEPHESKVAAFEITPPEAGAYCVVVNGLSGSFTVREAPPVILGEFTVRITNYDELIANAAAQGLEAQWYAQVPSSNRYLGVPQRYLMPTDGQAWRPITQDCQFLVPDVSEYWSEGIPPYLEIIIGAGPACNGWGWTDPTCRSYGTVYWSAPIEITPGCLVIYNYQANTLEVQR